ncbi:MAG: 23S rRNA (adenine(2030)-N(6))-methyltransferase RlmJ, partial [Hyphomicrobium sp.]
DSLNAVRAMNDDQGVHTYPGSPLLARMLMRSCDTLIANELHPEDCRILRSVLKGSPNTKVQEGDAFAALKSLLPPPEKRGLVLIDPPFEATGEFARVAGGAGEAVKRFATGTYVIWYPFKEPEAVTLFLRQIRGLGLRKVLNARLATAAPGRLPGLTDSGLLIINPPYVLAGQLAILGPVLAKVLRAAPGARFTLDDWSY